MPISFACNECKTPVRVNENLAGKHVRCRKCGMLMRVPGEALPVPRDNSAIIKWAVVGLCAIVLSVGGVFAWKFFQKPARLVRNTPPSEPKGETDAPALTDTQTPAEPKATPTAAGKSGLTAPPAEPKLAATPLGKALLSAPESSVATGALLNPAGLLEKLKRTADELVRTNASNAGMMNLVIQQAQAQAGIDLNNPRTLGIAGLDLSQPLTLAVLGMVPEKNEPGGFVIGAGLSDPLQFREAVKTLHQKAGRTLNPLSVTPELYGLDEASCLAVDGKEAFIIVSAPERLQQQALVFLKVRKDRRLQESENMTIALNGAGVSGDFALYVDLPRILTALPEKSPLASELKGVALSYGSGGGFFAQLDRAGSLHGLLKPGPSPLKVLERFDTPLVTLAGSLNDPVRLLQQTLHSTNSGARLIEIDNYLREKVDLGLADLSDILKDSSAGFLLFKGTDRAPFSGVLFFKPGRTDPDSLAQVKKLMERLASGFSAAFSRPDSPLAIPVPTVSVVDGVVFATTAPQLLTNYQLAQTPRSQPRIQPDDILYIDYRIGEMMQYAKALNPGMATPPVHIDGTSSMSVAIKRMPDGIKLYSDRSEIDVATISVIAAVAIPSLLRSRMAANETAAMYFCKSYMELQEIYKREDHDNDRVLEYAQSFGGEFGLTSVMVQPAQSTANARPTPLLDPKYAKAEGNPKDPTAPVAGYCMKILKAQGDRAKNGRIIYFAGKDMVAGHALVVYPKTYDSTGRKTFICNQDAVVYEADLGRDTHAIVELMTEFNPGPGWTPAE